MKTLSQVEPRTAITNLPFTISQSGSYYLTQNFSSRTGIVIQASNVTLDLMGFTVSGQETSSGITIFSLSGHLKNVVVMNGTIRNWNYGVLMHNVSGSRLENLIITDNTSNAGVDVWTTSSAGSESMYNIIYGCIIRNNGQGILLEAATSRTISGHTIRQNTISDNNGAGIELRTVSGTISDNRIVDNTIVGNNSDGIALGASTRNHVEGNFISRNSSRGISLAAVSTNSVIVRNTAIGNSGGNYGTLTGNIFGPIVTTPGTLSTTNGAPGLSPWANFSL